MFKNRYLTIGIFAGLLVITSLVVTFGGFVVEAVSSYAKDKQEVAPANYPHLAQNLQNDLNVAMSPEFPFDFDSAGNPFADKTGLSIDAAKGNAVSSNIGLPMSGKNPSSTGGSPVMPIQQIGGVIGSMPVPTPAAGPPPAAVVSSVDSGALLQERNRQIRQGKDVGDVAAIYSVDEVRPIGIIGTGDRNRIWLYSPSTKQTFTVRRGSRLHDGTIESVGSEGVEFRRDNGTVAFSRWMKNSQKSPAGENADAPLLRVEPSAPPVIQPAESASLPPFVSPAPVRRRRSNRKVNN